jgi:hypothetical protein
MERIDVKTLNGHIFTCEKCTKIHFEFNQLGIDFSSVDILTDFYRYMCQVDGDNIEKENKPSQYNKKIHIPFPNTTLKMVLSNFDLVELIVLVDTFIKEYNRQQKKYEVIRRLSKIKTDQLN